MPPAVQAGTQIFDNEMGVGHVKISQLKPFAYTEVSVPLAKDWLGFFTFKKSNRNKPAGVTKPEQI